MHANKTPSSKPKAMLPSALREPLKTALTHWLGEPWVVRVTPADGGQHPLDRALDRLMQGQRAITLPHVDRDHLAHLKAAADRMAMTVLEGSRLRPENGYTYRTVCCHGAIGVVLQLAIPKDAGMLADGILTVESVFTADEFNGMRAAIRQDGPWKDYGVSENLADQFKPREPTQDQTFDLDLDRPPPSPKMGF